MNDAYWLQFKWKQAAICFCPGRPRVTIDLCLLPLGRSCDRTFGIDLYASAIMHLKTIIWASLLTQSTPSQPIQPWQQKPKDSITTKLIVFKMCFWEGNLISPEGIMEKVIFVHVLLHVLFKEMDASLSQATSHYNCISPPATFHSGGVRLPAIT